VLDALLAWELDKASVLAKVGQRDVPVYHKGNITIRIDRHRRIIVELLDSTALRDRIWKEACQTRSSNGLVAVDKSENRTSTFTFIAR
jgi:hypothetical protein